MRTGVCVARCAVRWPAKWLNHADCALDACNENCAGPRLGPGGGRVDRSEEAMPRACAGGIVSFGRRPPAEPRGGGAGHRHGRVWGAPLELVTRWLLRLPGAQPRNRPRFLAGAFSSWRSSSSKAAPRSPARWSRPGTRTAPCPSSPPACSRRMRSSCTTCRASATWTRCSRSCRSLGVSVEWRGANELALCAADVHDIEIDPELAEQIRASFLLAGPLLARFGRARDAAPRRRCDRPQAPRSAPGRVQGDGSGHGVQPRDRAERPARACAPPTCSWTSLR